MRWDDLIVIRGNARETAPRSLDDCEWNRLLGERARIDTTLYGDNREGFPQPSGLVGPNPALADAEVDDLMAQFVVSKNSAILRDAIGALWMTIAGTVAALGVVAMSSTSVTEALVLLLIVLVVSFALYPSIMSTLRTC